MKGGNLKECAEEGRGSEKVVEEKQNRNLGKRENQVRHREVFFGACKGRKKEVDS